MEFQKIVEEVLNEDVVAGGAGSSFGPNVGATATEFSGDNYAPGDARVPKSLFGGVITRSGINKRKKKSKNKKKSK
jgi:hypothetical protein